MLTRNMLRRFQSVLLPMLLACAAAGPLGRVPKRHGVSTLVQYGADVLKLASSLLELNTPAYVYHMDNNAARAALIDKLWTGDYEAASGRFTEANPELVSIFSQQRIDGAEDARRMLLGSMPYNRLGRGSRASLAPCSERARRSTCR